MTTDRPAGITAIIALCVIVSIIALAFAVLVATGRTPLSAGAFVLGGGLEQLGPVAFLIYAALLLILAFALWKRWPLGTPGNNRPGSCRHRIGRTRHLQRRDGFAAIRHCPRRPANHRPRIDRVLPEPGACEGLVRTAYAQRRIESRAPEPALSLSEGSRPSFGC